MRPTVSVVVCCRGRWVGRLEVVRSLTRQTYGCDRLELLVVSNQRTGGGSLERWLRSLELPYSWSVVNEPRAGLSRARNRGMIAARGQFVIITDPDTRHADTWVSKLVTAHLEEQAIVVGGRVDSVFECLPSLELNQELRECFGPDTWPESRARAAAPYWITGCSMSIDRDQARRADLFFRADLGRVGRRLRDCEDIEFVERAKQIGAVIIEPAARADHPISGRELRCAYLFRQAVGHGTSLARMSETVPIWEPPRFPGSFRIASSVAALLGRGDSLSRAAAIATIRQALVYVTFQYQALIGQSALRGVGAETCRPASDNYSERV